MADITGWQAKALDHLRVVEIGGNAASLCAYWLAGLGAEVVKVEPPGGDPMRAYPPFAGGTAGPDRSVFHLHFNRSKKSVVLDIQDTDQRTEFVDLVKTADILVESFPTGHLDGLGVGVHTLRRLNPELVIVSVTPFGHMGRNAGYVGDDAIALAASGYMSWAGDNHRPPATAPAFQAHQLGGCLAAYGALAAIRNRAVTGRGQWLDFSLQDNLLFTCNNILRYTVDRTLTERAGAQNFNGAQIYACKDGYVFIAPFNKRAWNALEVDWMQDPVLSEEPFKSDRNYRRANVDIINTLHSDFIGQFTVEEFVEEAQKRHIPAAVVNSPAEFLESAQIQSRGYVTEAQHPVVGKCKVIKAPFGMKETPWDSTTPAPRLEEHQGLLAEGRRDVPAPKANLLSQPSSSRGEGAGRRRPLEGVRVLDFTRVRSGPTGTVILADLGADVMKVESTTLDPMRGIEYQGVQYDSNNRGKKSITLNLKMAEAREIFLELVKKCDVVVENFTYKVMDNLGIGYEELKKANPRIIMASMPPMGKTGPIAGWTTYGQQLMALSGMSYLWSYPDSPMPAHPKIPYPDDTAAAQMVLSIVAALEHRDRTGKGQFIEVAQLEGLAYQLGPAYMDYLLNGTTWEPRGNWHPVAAPFEAYRVRGDDEWVFISCETEEHWQCLVRVLGNAGWTADPRFATRESRREHKADLDANIGAWIQQYTAGQVVWMLQRGGVPAAHVMDSEDQYRDPHLWERGGLRREYREGWGMAEFRGPLGIFSDTPGEAGPAMTPEGHENVEVYGDLLGMSAEEVHRLEKEGVLK